MQLIDRIIPLDACTPAAGRPIVAIVVHHTATTVLPFPRRGASWHYALDQDGAVYRDVDEANVAHHVGQCDRWRPPWVVRPPSGVDVSAANWCTLSIEVVYAPQPPWDQGPTLEQESALRELLVELSTRYGGLPVVGHGELSTDKWETEPHGLDWAALGLGPRESDGRWLLAAAPPPPDPPDETAVLRAALEECNAIKREFEALLRDLESRRRLKRGTVDRLITEARGY